MELLLRTVDDVVSNTPLAVCTDRGGRWGGGGTVGAHRQRFLTSSGRDPEGQVGEEEESRHLPPETGSALRIMSRLRAQTSDRSTGHVQ